MLSLGSAQSRAAARAMLAARKESEDGLCFVAFNRGKRVNLDGLAGRSEEPD